MKKRMQKADLPDVIMRYWAAANGGDAGAACKEFAPEAVVEDENARHEGSNEILAWIRDTTKKYHPVVEPLWAETSGDKWSVRARVEGNFPGSPVELDFAFTLRGEEIVRLEVA